MKKRRNYSIEELIETEEVALVSIAKEVGIENARPMVFDADGLFVLDKNRLIQMILDMNKEKETHKKPKNLHKRIGLITAIVGAVATLVGTVVTVILFVLPDSSEYLGLEPGGGKAGGNALIFDSEFGYLTHGDLNRAENFFFSLETYSYNASLEFFGLSGLLNEFECFEIALLATNKGSHSIIITELAARITNIEQINEPLLLGVAQEALLNPTRGYEIVAYIENHGWAEANDAIITVSDSLGELQGLINTYPLSINVGTIESGNTTNAILLSNDMFIQESIPDDGLYISLDGILSYIDNSGILQEQEMHIYDFFLTPDGIRAPINGGAGDGEFDQFGIFIDADKKNIDFTRNTRARIPPGEVIDLPIMLFADRSISFDLEIEITVNYSDTNTLAVFTGIDLFVSSIVGHYSRVDGELLDQYSLEIDDIAFFPFSH